MAVDFALFLQFKRSFFVSRQHIQGPCGYVSGEPHCTWAYWNTEHYRFDVDTDSNQFHAMRGYEPVSPSVTGTDSRCIWLRPFTTLSSGRADPDLVERIARLDQKGKVRRNSSFATKYCWFHRPDVCPIYDSLVVEILNGLLKQGKRSTRSSRARHGTGTTASTADPVAGFQQLGLEEFSIRDIDKYLWMVAKER